MFQLADLMAFSTLIMSVGEQLCIEQNTPPVKVEHDTWPLKFLESDYKSEND